MKCNEAKKQRDRGMLTRTMRQGILSRVVMCLPVCSVLLLSSCVQCWLGSVIIAIQMQTKDTWSWYHTKCSDFPTDQIWYRTWPKITREMSVEHLRMQALPDTWLRPFSWIVCSLVVPKFSQFSDFSLTKRRLLTRTDTQFGISINLINDMNHTRVLDIEV